MKKFKIASIATVALVLSLSLSALTASAASIEASRNGASNFEKAWKAELSTADKKGKMQYGFNKFAIDEDFTWTIHDSNGHTAIVTRGSSNSSSSSGSAGSWAKVEVTHNNVSVKYTMNY